MLAGDNGLLNKTSDSELKNRIGLYKEELALSITADQIDNKGNRNNRKVCWNIRTKLKRCYYN